MAARIHVSLQHNVVRFNIVIFKLLFTFAVSYGGDSVRAGACCLVCRCSHLNLSGSHVLVESCGIGPAFCVKHSPCLLPTGVSHYALPQIPPWGSSNPSQGRGQGRHSAVHQVPRVG